MKELSNGNRLFRFGIAFNFFLGLCLLVALAGDFFHVFNVTTNAFIFLSLVAFISVLVSALQAIYSREVTVDLLAVSALVFSFLAGEWYSATFINLMLVFARIFSYWTELRERNIIAHLLKYRPALVMIKRGGHVISVPLEHVLVGDIVSVAAGARVPIDGVILEGRASIDESTLTGESEPISKREGDEVLSSTLVVAGSLTVRATRVGEDATLSKIIALIEGAGEKKAKTDRIVTRFTIWYIAGIFIVSFLTYILTHDLRLVLSILLVACADDIAVSVPLAFTVAIARAAKRGILIKGADVLEKIPQITYIMTDKTGTLTVGKPVVVHVEHFGKSLPQVLALAGSLALQSRHPLSKAIVAHCKEQGIDLHTADDVHEDPGDGLRGTVRGTEVFFGRKSFLERHGMHLLSEQNHLFEKYSREGYSVTLMGTEDDVIGMLISRDTLRTHARSAIAETCALGVQGWTMLTGDNHYAAELVAKEVGITDIQAGVTPEEKVLYIEDFKKKHPGIIAMVGDGVNDAASVAFADVSIAMGKNGADVSVEASDITLMKDNLNRIPESILLARSTMAVVRQNFWIWGIVNVVGLSLVFMHVLDPIGASAYNFVTDIFPILNALRAGGGAYLARRT